MALFQSLNQLTIISGPPFLPSVKMAAGARLHHSAHAVQTALPLPVLPRDGTAHSLAAPRFWHPRPHPLSGCPRPFRLPSPEVDIAAWRRGRRGECFRGSGPWVGVCKLASVPAGAAVATGLAQCAGVWRRRRAAGETAGGRSWQVSETDSEFHQENSVGKPRLADSFSSDSRQEPDRVLGFLEHLSSLRRTLNSI